MNVEYSLLVPILALLLCVAVYFLQSQASKNRPSRTLRGAGRCALIAIGLVAAGALLAVGAKLVL